MGLSICSLGSGSRGNCVYIASEGARLLVDMGLPLSRVEQSLKAIRVLPETVDAVLITHTHTDHVGGLGVFCKKHKNVRVFCHRGSVEDVNAKLVKAQTRATGYDTDFFLNDLTVSPFAISHDVPCFGYSFYSKGKKVSLATDLGYIDARTVKNISDSDVVMLEANHDEEMLSKNNNYSAYLKKRILSARGHLSNAAAAEAAAYFADGGVKQLILAHLSEENNRPSVALNTVMEFLKESGAREGMRLEVAEQNRMSSLFEVV